jgi:hypothetical protein
MLNWTNLVAAASVERRDWFPKHADRRESQNQGSRRKYFPREEKISKRGFLEKAGGLKQEEGLLTRLQRCEARGQQPPEGTHLAHWQGNSGNKLQKR